MTKLIVWGVVLFLITSNGHAEKIELSEGSIKKIDFSSIPIVRKIKLMEMGKLLRLNQVEDAFTPEFILSAQYGENKSRQLNRFVPVTSPIKGAKMGFKKATSFGLQFQTHIFAEQFTNNFLRRSTTVGAEFDLSLDLYKDIFGRSTRKKLKNLQLESEVSAAENIIATHQFKINLLKIYWGLVANNESINITEQLIAQAKKQVSVTAEKVRNSVSDRGTLARTKSLLSARKGSLNSLEYQRSNLLRTIRELVPEYSDKEIVLGDYDIQKTIQDLFVCTNKLQQNLQAPLESTLFDDIAVKNLDVAIRDKAIARIHDDVDLKLNVKAQLNGKDFSYSDGVTNLQDDPRSVTTVSLMFSAPIGGQKKKTSKNLENVASLKNKIAKEEIDAKLKAYHVEILQSIKVLESALLNQNNNTASLRESLKSSRTKFNQARITIEQLVGEEDAYFSSELSNIQTNLSIIHTVLDYFTVFHGTQCPLNI